MLQYSYKLCKCWQIVANQKEDKAMTTKSRREWNMDLARGFDKTIWNAMQSQRIGKKLRVEIVAESPKEEEAKFFASCTAWSYHEQNYRFYIHDDGEETVISVYQEDMSGRRAGSAVELELEQPISYLERRCCYEQLRDCCDEAVSFLFANRVWK